VLKILQGSVVTQNVLSGLTVYPPPPAANFLVYMCQKVYKVTDTKLLQ